MRDTISLMAGNRCPPYRHRPISLAFSAKETGPAFPVINRRTAAFSTACMTDMNIILRLSDAPDEAMALKYSIHPRAWSEPRSASAVHPGQLTWCTSGAAARYSSLERQGSFTDRRISCSTAASAWTLPVMAAQAKSAARRLFSIRGGDGVGRLPFPAESPGRGTPWVPDATDDDVNARTRTTHPVRAGT